MTDNRKALIKEALVKLALHTVGLVLLVLVVTAIIAIIATEMAPQGHGGF